MNSQHMHRIHEMRDEIDSLHSSYLQSEECLKKIREQTKLEDVINEYLSVVPHLEKFFFPKISYVLHNSIRDKKDFSPFKAISAWSALAKYAHNILTQPWRKEFYTIQKFGGYFSHVVKEILVDWEIVFELMGYNTTKDVMTLQKPIDPDKITFVARDCFIAQVECQIMMRIYANVLKMHNECTWQDILEFRENHICSDDQAIRDLSTIFMQRQQEEYIRGTCIPHGPPYGYVTLPPFHSSPCLRLNDYKQLSSYGNGIIGIPPYPKMAHGKCEYSHFMSPDYPYPNCLKHIQNPIQLNDSSYIQHFQGNGYGMPYQDKAVCPQSVYRNNSQYLGLDVDERDHCSNCHSYNYGGCPFIYSNNKFGNQTFDNHSQRNKHLGKYDNSVIQGSTDYQQRKNKDSFTPNVKCGLVTVNDLENAMKAFAYDFDKNTVSENNQSEKTHLNNVVSESPPISSQNSNKCEQQAAVWSGIWECEACTFHNSTIQSICELCGKSRNAGNEKIPLISGGRQCLKCTLVNEKDAKTCEACATSLKDSPTYI